MNDSFYSAYKESLSYKHFIESPYSSSKHINYFQIYDHLFLKYRDHEIVFVEVGVLNGGSLFMWKNFFGEKARIIGIDLNPEAKKWEEYGFEIYIGDASDTYFWDIFFKKIGKIDILLDDGGHTYSQQVVTVESVLNYIKDGGLLVIEDIHTSYLRGFGPRRYTFMKYVKTVLDKIILKNINLNRGIARVWSIQFFNSMVVFYVDELQSKTEHSKILNSAPSQKTRDFRYYNKYLYSINQKYGRNKLFRFFGLKVLILLSYFRIFKTRYYKYFK
jgi:hypothetical protein